MQMMFEHLISKKKKKALEKSQILLFRLFDGENVTCDDYHMWLCPFSTKEKVRIMITLSVSKRLHGLRIWNYNKSPDDTYRGVNLK